jgi:GAF domain-containing protein
MMRFSSSSWNDRSLLRPRSEKRFLGGWALAAGAPAAAALLSSHAPHLVAGLTFLTAVALAALVGRMGPGLLSLALSAVLLAIQGGTPEEARTADAAGLASLAVFVVLGAALAWGIPRLELAAIAMRRNARRLVFLSGASMVLEETLDRREALRRLADYLVPELSDWCVIHLRQEDGSIEPIAVAHVDPTKVAAVKELQARQPVATDAQTGVAQVLRTGRAEFASRIDADALQGAGADRETVRIAEDLGMHSAIMVPLTARGHTAGVLSLVLAQEDREYEQEDLAFASELADRAALTLDTHSAYERTREAADRNEILQRLATALSRSVSLTDVVETVLVEGVREMAAQSALIANLSEDTRTLEVLGQHGYDPQDLARWSTFPVSAALPMSEAVRTRSSVIVHDEADRDRRFPLLSSMPMRHHSLVCLPLIAGGEVVGGMSVAFPIVRPFSEGDEGFLMAVASMTGQAMRRATLYETERTTSRLLQESLLPRRLPTIPGLRFAARYWASGRDVAVGGDFYDVVDSPGGCMALIGDVCGRGVEAAAVMGIARHAAWSAAETESSPAAVLTVVNDVLRRRVDDYRFVTMCAVLLEPVEDWFAATVACGGHPLPIRIAQGRVEPVGLTGMLLGIYEDPPLREQRVRLAPAESLVLHTDGVVERGGSHLPFAEDEALTRAVREAGPDAERVARSIEAVLMSEHTLVDDAAVLVVSAAG